MDEKHLHIRSNNQPPHYGQPTIPTKPRTTLTPLGKDNPQATKVALNYLSMLPLLIPCHTKDVLSTNTRRKLVQVNLAELQESQSKQYLVIAIRPCSLDGLVKSQVMHPIMLFSTPWVFCGRRFPSAVGWIGFLVTFIWCPLGNVTAELVYFVVYTTYPSGGLVLCWSSNIRANK